MASLFFKCWRLRSVIIYALVFAFSLAIMAPSVSAWAPPDPQTDLTREAEDHTDGHPWTDDGGNSSGESSFRYCSILLKISLWLSGYDYDVNAGEVGRADCSDNVCPTRNDNDGSKDDRILK